MIERNQCAGTFGVITLDPALLDDTVERVVNETAFEVPYGDE